ncbi:MAG: sigma-54-dependent Fis family transcriptional regulator [Deltaproteobacteria bacterium]|nr:sigma-54-dependent Fis family transcriptional regulator [Deltaproteobacteria bacterium]
MPARPVATPAPRQFFGMVGACEPMLQLFRQVERVARFSTTVLIHGESGTGKELVARALHQASPRAAAPFVAINCGAIPEHLLESELFGHVRGAYTDASSDRPGLFEAADGGTLLLDEITDLPLALQVKLLRVLQDGEVRRLGSNKSIAVDVRVAAASAVSARQRVREGLFREDLFYRLSVIELRVPALRDRLGDLDLLVAHLIEGANRRLGTAIAGLSPGAWVKLRARRWPGNVRELKNAIEQACVLADGPWIAAELIASDPAGAAPAPTLTLDNLSIPLAIEATERALIGEALQRTAGNRTRAAALLDISTRNLHYKIKQYGIAAAPHQGRPPRLETP